MACRDASPCVRSSPRPRAPEFGAPPSTPQDRARTATSPDTVATTPIAAPGSLPGSPDRPGTPPYRPCAACRTMGRSRALCTRTPPHRCGDTPHTTPVQNRAPESRTARTLRPHAGKTAARYVHPRRIAREKSPIRTAQPDTEPSSPAPVAANSLRPQSPHKDWGQQVPTVAENRPDRDFASSVPRRRRIRAVMRHTPRSNSSRVTSIQAGHSTRPASSRSRPRRSTAKQLHHPSSYCLAGCRAAAKRASPTA